MTLPSDFQQILKEQPCIMADGALGTSYFELGLKTGDAPEFWNIHAPEKVLSVHENFLHAGANIILTNSFGGSRHRLKLHNAAHCVSELNEEAAILAHKAKENCGKKSALIAGSIGPTGELLEPNGPHSIDDIAEVFFEQACALKKGGVDLLWAETMSSKEEAIAVSIAAHKANMPLSITLTFDTNGKTMMGVHPNEVRDLTDNLATKPVSVGLNCGKSPYESMVSLYHITHQQDFCDILIVAKANRGIPVYKDGSFSFNGTHKLMVDYAITAYQLGARIIGGCCGTDHVILKSMCDALQKTSMQDLEEKDINLEVIYERLGAEEDKIIIENKTKRKNRHRSTSS